MEIVIAIGIMGGLGLALGLVLALASKVFFVKTDPRLDELKECLPGADCGGCGYAGCGGYAQAVLEGKAPIGNCAAGGTKSAKAMAAIMGVTVEEQQRKVAQVRCSGFHTVDENGNELGSHLKGVYEGLKDCLSATKVAGHGPVSCKFGCLGFGTCTTACKYDAIHIENGVAKVDREKCVGCMACAAVCPRHLIVPVNYDSHAIVPCASNAKGAVTLRSCSAGCIGCSKCVKTCPNGAIRVEGNLAVIDEEKCTACGLCVEACPRKLIMIS